MKSPVPFLVSALALGGLVGCDETPAGGGVEPPAGYRIVRRIETPGETSVETPGKEITRDVTMWRWASPFGESPGAVLMAQKPMSVAESTTPGLNITAEGAAQTAGTQGRFVGGAGGGTWYQMLFGKIKDYALMLGGGLLAIIVAGAAAWFLVPAARPILSGILRFFASLFPVLGSTVESAIGRTKVATVQRPLEEVIDTIQQFKGLLAQEPSLTLDQKARIGVLLAQAYDKSQNDSTAAMVKRIKAEA